MRFMPLISRRVVRRRTPSFRDWRRRRLACEQLEDRRPLATFLVTTAEDDGVGSLRQAILDSNAAPNSAQPDLIAFQIAGATRSIPIGSTTGLPLPPIIDPVVIDGTTQDGFTGVPLIELVGATAGSKASGLTIQSGQTTVRGLVINGFNQHGIRIEEAGANRIEGNYVGTDVTGLVSRPNDGDGVSIFGSSGNVVGGTSASQRNLISGNDGTGVAIAAGTQSIDSIRSFGPPPLGPPYTGTFAPHESLSAFNGQSPNGTWVLNVRDQYLGADDGHVRAFSLIIANANNQTTTHGYSGPPVAVPAADGSSINLPVTVNGFDGSIADLNFRIDGTSESDPGVEHTYVGDLVFALTSPGGTTVTLINGSSSSGQNFLQTVLDDPTNVPGGNVVQGNLIGTDVTGSSPLSNRSHGVLIDGSQGNLIGGAQPGASNVISGNGLHGISIRGGTAAGNQFMGNSIGAGVGGTLAIPNRFGGISILDGSGNTIGGIQPGAGNTIAYNEDRGIHILSGKENSLLGNAIFANRSLGIDLAEEFDDFGVTPNDAGPPPDSDDGPNRLQNFPVWHPRAAGQIPRS